MKFGPSILIVSLIVGLACSAGIVQAEQVTLTDKNGREITAQLQSLENDELSVRVTGRGNFTLKMEQLSKESQALVKEKLSSPESNDAPGVLVQVKELVVEDALTAADWSENWKGGKGDFYAKEDRVEGVEDPAENHAAGAGRRQEMKSAVVQVDFRFDDSNQMGIVIDFKADTGDKYDNQHVMKLQIREGKFTLWGGTGWSDQTKRTQVGEPVDVEIKEGWNTVLLEFHKQEMVGHLNGEVVNFGSTEEPIQAPKNQVTLSAHGTVSFRNLKVWAGDEESAHPDWEKTRKKL